jgi:surface carbohydrate biosynthesis protein
MGFRHGGINCEERFMNGSRLIWRIKTFYQFFIAPSKIWKLPKKSDVVIYDASGAELVLPYLNEYDVAVVPLRGESVNIQCLLRAMFKRRFWTVKPLQIYAETFIEAVSPKVAITFIDNNVNFYTLSRLFPSTKTIFIQNGLRGGGRDIFASLTESNRYHVDYMLVFNSAFGEKYNRFIEGEYFPIGSFKNNNIKKQAELKQDGVLFISQYRPKPENSVTFTVDAAGIPVSWEKFYSSEALVLSFLKEWCIKNHRLLKIAGCTTEFQNAERDFFAANLDGLNWEYVPKSNLYGSYKAVDEAEVVVFIDSALGFESIGRGKKTAGLSCRGRLLNDESINFGWPATLPDNGPFWTNDPDERQFQRVMDYVAGLSTEAWERISLTHSAHLMAFDPGNTRFEALIAHLLPISAGGAGRFSRANSDSRSVPRVARKNK